MTPCKRPPDMFLSEMKIASVWNLYLFIDAAAVSLSPQVTASPEQEEGKIFALFSCQSSLLGLSGFKVACGCRLRA